MRPVKIYDSLQVRPLKYTIHCRWDLLQHTRQWCTRWSIMIIIWRLWVRQSNPEIYLATVHSQHCSCGT